MFNLAKHLPQNAIKNLILLTVCSVHGTKSKCCTSVKVNSNNLSILSAISFSIGAVIDEAQGHNANDYVFDRSTKCSRARLVLVFKWLIVGVFLTMSYKAVFRSMMMKIDYEKTIDTLDDLLQSDMKLLVAGDTILRQFVDADSKFKELREKERVEYYLHGKTGPKQWVFERYTVKRHPGIHGCVGEILY